MTARRLAWWLLALTALLAAVSAVVLFYASRSEAVLRWGIARLSPRLPCELSLQGLSGALDEPLRVERLTCENAQLRVEARQVLMEWSPWLLAQERLEISRLQAQSLTYLDKQAGSGLTPPVDLPLPFPVRIRSLELGSLVVESGTRASSLGEINLEYEGDALTHRIRLHRAAGDLGRVEGEAVIGARAPLPLAAQIRFEGTLPGDWPLRAAVTLSGPLAQPIATVEGSVRAMPFSASVRLAPFEDDPVAAARIRATGVDLSVLAPKLPTSALEIEIAGQGQGFEAFTGELSVINPEPGPLDRGRLPLERLNSRLRVTAQSLELRDAGFGLGAAGTAQADLVLHGGTLQLDAQVTQLDLRKLHGRLRQTRLSGNIRADADRERQRVSAKLREKGLEMQAEALVLDRRVDIAQLVLRAGGAQASASGQVQLDAALAFSMRGELRRFDPSRFGDFPKAQINGWAKIRGLLRPHWQASVDYRLGRSRYLGEALSGAGRLTLAPGRVSDTDARIALGPNRAVLRGAFGAIGDSMHFDIRAPRLAALDLGIEGGLAASGIVTGTPSRPALQARVEGEDLAYQQYRVRRWSARADIEQGEDPRLEVHAQLEEVQRGELEVAAVNLLAGGTLSAHAIELAVGSDAVRSTARLEGGWSRERALWSGTVTRFENAGEYAFQMTRPAPLRLATGLLELGATRVLFQQTEIALEETTYRDGQWSTTGSVNGVRLARLLPLLPDMPLVESTLVVGARWSVRAGRSLDGEVEISRESGDVVVAGEETIALGLEEARLVLRAEANRVHAQLSVAGAGLRAQAQAQTLAERRGMRWGVSGGAPLAANASATLRSVAVLAPLVGGTFGADGSLSVELQAQGTVSQPGVRGTLSGARLKLEEIGRGIFLRDGALRATFADGAFVLNELRFRGGEGTFSAEGSLVERDGATRIEIEWSAQKLAVVQHPELRLVVTGAGTLVADNTRVALAGALTAHHGRIELRSESAPALGADVIVAGREKPEPPASRLPGSELDLQLDLGPDVRITGRGLDSQLAGGVRLTSSGGSALAARGEIRTVGGTYAAYGQKLSVEQGVLYFSGPVDNPALRIRALRKNQPVEAGVEVTGTARNPIVRLISNPDVPDPEKLAWLVLGRRVGSGSGSDAETLQTSAAALAAGLGTAPLQQQLARSVRLDELRVEPGSEPGQGGVVAVGKRVSDRIYLTHERSLSTASSVLRVTYQLSQRWSLRTESGTSDAVDLFYTISFD